MTDSLRQEAIKRAKKVGVSADAMKAAILATRGDKPYVVEFEDFASANGSFYRVTQEGPTRVLYINTDHPFFYYTYAEAANAQQRAALELVLWSMGVAELEASEEDQKRYQYERGEWSRQLSVGLKELQRILDPDDFEQWYGEKAHRG